MKMNQDTNKKNGWKLEDRAWKNGVGVGGGLNKQHNNSILSWSLPAGGSGRNEIKTIHLIDFK
jgi:hypothetical protein